MLSRFFHVRSALKPFAAPAASPTVESGGTPRPEPIHPHVDYDRHPLETSGFDHYVEWNEDDERFFVH
ncbi:MAG TPA: hypothetical protein VFH59_12340 [Frateuria sp.]|uniref:hypothetical protein n=1 Tax=Frateuria sp. TaxID=2211372 RepID=UPI002D7FC8B0|nr:hypothetical protein [Frateuria sp.]HET6806219.1 hypothetical protein [Frateuria sp.]